MNIRVSGLHFTNLSPAGRPASPRTGGDKPLLYVTTNRFALIFYCRGGSGGLPSGREIKMTSNTPIPDDPLMMPPPFWQDCEAIDQLIRALQEIPPLLDALSTEIKEIDPLLDKYEQNKETTGGEYDTDAKIFNEIMETYCYLVYSIGSRVDLSILMAAITIETLLNKFCVYNFPKDLVEPLEKLNPPEKLCVASAILRSHGAKSLAPHGAAKELYRWRNNYAHGHCVAQSAKGLYKNHLRLTPISALDRVERQTPEMIKLLQNMLRGFLQIYDYLAEITINNYVVNEDREDILLIRELINEISRYTFTDKNYPYEIIRPTQTT